MEERNEQLFYIGTYASREERGIYIGALHTDNGDLRMVGGVEGIERPSFLALHPNGAKLYAASETDQGELYTYQVNNQTGELHPLDRKGTEGAHTCYVSVTTDGRYVLASNYSGGNAVVFPATEAGGLGDMSGQVQHTGSGIRQDRQDAPHPHSIIPDPSGQYAMVCDLGLDQIIGYRLTEDGKLVTHRETDLPPGSGPRHLVFHPSGRYAFVANELNNTVAVFGYNERNGKLTLLQSLSTLPEGIIDVENTAADIRITPCGRFLYVSNRGHDSIVLYHVDLDSGKLKTIEWVESFGSTPRNFNILSGYLLVANQEGNNIVSFAIHEDDGRLTRTGYVLEVPSPVCMEPVR
ncbi:lactonase family protein [Paenibacillus polymyxa]|uniref:lactonase family protein n=1 Tax=Paenibacillus TaxID=44249 RepID=UPI000E3D533F|nr:MULTISPECIES: lactonase family protein [Paenibacillus]RFT92312.1 lactonase family protein [Paenibacillus jamilae]URJ36983.1 lactonase family protein [Paenibacillus polymyxa]